MKFFAFISFAAAFASCNVPSSSTSNDSSVYGNANYSGSSANFAAAQAVLKQNCATCHEHSAWASYNETNYVSGGLVSAQNLNSSAVWTKLSINGGDMPQGGSLSSDQVLKIQNWIANMSTSSASDPASQRTRAAMTVLQTNCISCHNGSNTAATAAVPNWAAYVTSYFASGDVNAVNTSFIQNNLVVDGYATNSLIYKSLTTYGNGAANMPYQRAALSASDAQSIADWINGIPNN